MPNFQQCHRCRITLPIQYLTVIPAKEKSSGRIIRVRVCNACRDIIIKQQGNNNA